MAIFPSSKPVATEAGRQAHLDGPIARGLGEVAEALFETVDLQTIEILAAK